MISHASARLKSLGLVLLLLGCAQATPISKTADGRDQYIIECDGSAVPVSTCYKKANAVCPNGYDIVGNHRSGGSDFYGHGIQSTITGASKHIFVACFHER